MEPKFSELKVKFVKHEGEVLALFPTEKWNHYNENITCYAHMGQHGEASRSLLRSKRAKPEEYYDLLVELRKIYETPFDDQVIILKVV